MVHEFKLPDVGDEESADLLKWMVQEGDGVREDDPVAEVETERAIIEIPSPVDGEVLELCVGERESVKIGETIARFDTEEDGDDGREEGGVEILDKEGKAAVDVDAEAENEFESEYAEEEADDDVASPSTRHLAREVGVDIEEIEGSGADGRVVAQDILRAAKRKQDEREEENGREDAEDSEDPGVPEPAKEDTRDSFDGEEPPSVGEKTEETSMFSTESETETGDEKASVGAVDDEAFEKQDEDNTKEQEVKEATETSTPEESKNSVEEEGRAEVEKEAASLVTHHDIADAERMAELSEGIETEDALTAFFLKACGAAYEKYPLFGEKETDIRLARRTEEGTDFPVIEDIGEKGVTGIAAELNDGTETVEPEKSDSVLTVYDKDTVGREGATPAPDGQGAAVAFGEVRRRPSVVDEEVVARYTVPLSVTFDRNLADERQGGLFIEALRQYIEEPARIVF